MNSKDVPPAVEKRFGDGAHMAARGRAELVANVLPAEA